MALKKITKADFDAAIKANVENGKIVWWKVLGTTDEGTDLCLVVGWADGSDVDKEDRETSYFDEKNEWVLRSKIGYAHSNLYAMDYDDFYMPYNLKDDKKNGIYEGDVWDTDMFVGKGGPSDFDIKWYNDEAQEIWDAFGTPKGEDEEAPLDLMESKKTKGESKMKKCSMQKKIESVGKKSEIRTSLEPRFDSRKSFYGKAQVEDDGNSKTLYSYNTPVARVTDGKLELLPKWNFSQTTRRHVADFVKQMGVEDQYLKLKKGESKGCSMQKKIESLVKKSEGTSSGWDVDFFDRYAGRYLGTKPLTFALNDAQDLFRELQHSARGVSTGARTWEELGRWIDEHIVKPFEEVSQFMVDEGSDMEEDN